MKATKQQFKPIYLYSEDIRQKETLRLYDESISELNKLVQVCETVINGKLTNSQKIKIEGNGIPHIVTEVEGSFKFPNATREFNLDALGVDLEPLYEQDLKFRSIKFKYTYKLLDGVFVRDEKQTNSIKTGCEVYSDNIKQNKLLDYCLKLEKIFNTAVDDNVISEYDLVSIVNAVGGLELVVKDNGKGYIARADKKGIKTFKSYRTA